jgi:hypothetical protein
MGRSIDAILPQRTTHNKRDITAPVSTMGRASTPSDPERTINLQRRRTIQCAPFKPSDPTELKRAMKRRGTNHPQSAERYA